MPHQSGEQLQPFRLGGQAGVLGELEAPEGQQVPADVVGEQRPGGGEKVGPQPGDCVAEAPVGLLQLVIVQIEKQTAVVVEHRGHAPKLQSVVVIERAKVACVSVDIKNQRIQDAHPPEGVAIAQVLETVQQPSHGAGRGQRRRLGQAKPFAGEQGALGHQLSVVVVQIVVHKVRTELPGHLGGQILRQRLNAEQSAGLIELHGAVRLPHPALGVLPIGAELRRGGGQGGTAAGTVEGGLGDDLIKGVAVEGHLRPRQRGIRRLHPERVVQREGVGHVQVAVQRLAAVGPEQGVDVGPVLGGFPPLQKVGEFPIAKGPLFRVPRCFPGGDLQKFVPLTPEFQPDAVFVQEKIVHQGASN